MTFEMPANAGWVGFRLRVRDLSRALVFWRDLLGLSEVARERETVVLAPARRNFTVELEPRPDAPLRLHPSIGLYHVALLLPNRTSLAAVVRRLLDAGVAFEGASDHGVSQALYFRDPEGNGLELYWDRPRETWPRPSTGEGVAMVTRPLPLEDLLALADRGEGLPPDTRMGHIHLHVPDLDAAEAFFVGLFGMKVTQRDYPGARFFAAGDYHHHVGVNVWARGRRADPRATGLVLSFWQVPKGTLTQFENHLRAQGAVFGREGSRLWLQDPADSRVVVLEDEGTSCTSDEGSSNTWK